MNPFDTSQTKLCDPLSGSLPQGSLTQEVRDAAPMFEQVTCLPGSCADPGAVPVSFFMQEMHTSLEEAQLKANGKGVFFALIGELVGGHGAMTVVTPSFGPSEWSSDRINALAQSVNPFRPKMSWLDAVTHSDPMKLIHITYDMGVGPSTVESQEAAAALLAAQPTSFSATARHRTPMFRFAQYL